MNKLKASDEFVKGKHNIGWISSDFTNAFKAMEFEAHCVPTFQKLPRSMNDAAIESELKPGLSELGDVLAFLDNAPEETKDGYCNLFYFPAFVVRVYWHVGEWSVYAWIRYVFDWNAGYRVFSPATVASSTIPSSDTLNLETLKKLKKISQSIQNTEDSNIRESKIGYLLGTIDSL